MDEKGGDDFLGGDIAQKLMALWQDEISATVNHQRHSDHLAQQFQFWQKLLVNFNDASKSSATTGAKAFISSSQYDDERGGDERRIDELLQHIRSLEKRILKLESAQNKSKRREPVTKPSSRKASDSPKA